MAHDEASERGGTQPTAESVARKTFGTSFRGYDQPEVRAYLAAIADQWREMRDREADLRTRLDAAEARVAEPEPVDEYRMTQILGEETTRVLAAAREAAAEIRSKAEESVARLLREAQDEAASLRADAEARGERIRQAAEEVRAQARAEAEAEIEAARQQGREMVGEAQAVRERVLSDLSRRRKQARAQIEQLRAGRERLLAAYDVVRQTIDDATNELRLAIPDAKEPVDAAPVPEPEPVIESVPDPEPEPEVEPPRLELVRDPEPEPAPEPVAEPSNVDELFARLREGRPDVEQAREVLAEPEPEPGPPSEVAVEVVSMLERRDAATDDVERRLARRLKRVLSDEQNEVLDRLRRGGGASIDDLLPSRAEQAARYAGVASADLASGAVAGAEFHPDGALDGPETRVDDLAAELAGMLVGLLRDRVARAVDESAGDPDELADRIRSCYREWKTQRIGETARHFVLAAFTRGLFDAARDGEKLCWVIDDGGTPCPDAEDNALAGALEKGDPFPTGHLYPPAHPGCRCLIVPERPRTATTPVSERENLP